jgi:glycopeptide antibiotics resistance protein
LRAIIRTKKAFIIYVAIVLLLVTLPINSAGELNDIVILRFRGDYFLHSVMFIPWMLFFRVTKVNFWFWFLFGILFAAGSESIQYILPYRAFNINDLMANLIGTFMGAVIVIGINYH